VEVSFEVGPHNNCADQDPLASPLNKQMNLTLPCSNWKMDYGK
jgi:hypothetical protein